MPDHARSTQVTDTEANALGMLWKVCPKLALKCTRLHNYAKAIQTYLRAVDFYCLQNGVSPRKISVDSTVHDGRIVQRILG